MRVFHAGRALSHSFNDPNRCELFDAKGPTHGGDHSGNVHIKYRRSTTTGPA